MWQIAGYAWIWILFGCCNLCKSESGRIYWHI